MLRIDSFIEWLVIALGVLAAIGTIYPGISSKLGKTIITVIPEPSTVNDWLRKIGL